ncbi:MAG: flavin reductase [Bradyrhizobium sp.]|nr:MAG: flavin reductase [Bradyrhizobium sp.]
MSAFGAQSTKPRLADAMRQLAGAVAVITAGRGPARTGYTGTAVFSLSIDPERLVISVGRSSSSYPAIRDSGFFGLNILRADQQAIADRFAGRGGVKGEARYAGAEWKETPAGVCLLVGALAAIELRVEEIIERHSHAIIIGEPLSIAASSVGEGLVYWRSTYRSTANERALAADGFVALDGAGLGLATSQAGRAIGVPGASEPSPDPWRAAPLAS